MKKTFNVETVHDTAGRKMIQAIGPFTIVVDWNFDTVKVMKDAVQVSMINMNNGFTLDEYEKLLLEIEDSVEQLNGF